MDGERADHLVGHPERQHAHRSDAVLHRGGPVGVRRERARQVPICLDGARSDRDPDRPLPCLRVGPRDANVVERLDAPRRGDRLHALLVVALGEAHPRQLVVPGVHDGATGLLQQRLLVPGVDERLVGLPERAKRLEQVLGLGDVAGVDHDAVNRGVVKAVGGHDLEVLPVPGARPEAIDRRRMDPRLGDVPDEGLGRHVPIVRVDQAEDVVGHLVGRGVAEHPSGRGVGVEELAARVQHRDQVARVAHERVEQVLRLDPASLDPGGSSPAGPAELGASTISTGVGGRSVAEGGLVPGRTEGSVTRIGKLFRCGHSDVPTTAQQDRNRALLHVPPPRQCSCEVARPGLSRARAPVGDGPTVKRAETAQRCFASQKSAKRLSLYGGTSS